MLTELFAPIVKTEKNPDGSLFVFGKATGPDLDFDLQICDPAWLAKAMPEWMQYGNLREQHGRVAAGVAVELTQDGDSWMIKGLVVDPVTVAKVEAKVLKGFSIGISGARVVKDAAAPGGRIVDGSIPEVSLVDRPCNPTCGMVIQKSAGGVNEWVTKDVVPVPDLAGSGGEPAPAAGDEAAEADIVDQIRALASAWLASEAAEVAAGTGGTMVVRLILDLLSDLNWAECEDTWDDQTMMTEMAARAEQMKAAFSAPTKETPVNIATLLKSAEPADVEGLRALLGLDKIDERVTAAETATGNAVTKAEAAEGRLVEVVAELEAVKTLAAPGGPHRTRTNQQLDDAADNERAALAVRYGKLASSATDPTLAEGYRQLAKNAAAPLERT